MFMQLDLKKYQILKIFIQRKPKFIWSDKEC